MDHLEMVEKLREKANVTYEEASAALEKCNWDLLDALLMLEGEGRLQDEKPQPEKAQAEAKVEKKPHCERKKHGKGIFASLLHGVGVVVNKCNAISVQIKKNGEVRITLPILVVVLLLIVTRWWGIGAAAIAMLFGYRYALKGMTIDEPVNKAMDKAGEFVDDVVKSDVRVVRNPEEKQGFDVYVNGEKKVVYRNENADAPTDGADAADAAE